MELRPRLMVATVVPAAIRERLVALDSAAPAAPGAHRDSTARRVVAVTAVMAEKALFESIQVCPVVTVAKAELVAQLEMAETAALVARPVCKQVQVLVAMAVLVARVRLVAAATEVLEAQVFRAVLRLSGAMAAMAERAP